MKFALSLLFILMVLKEDLSAQKRELSDYYSFINKAELNICNNEHNRAFMFYDSAFLTIGNRKPYYKDVYNALISAITADNDIYILKYWSFLCQLGLDSTFINRSEKINSLKNKNYWQKLKDDMELYDKGKNSRYLFLRQIADNDQKIRIECEVKAKGIGDKYVVFKDTIMFVDSVNYMMLIADFKANGFPHDNISNNLNPFSHPIYFYILEHNAMWNRIWMDSMILKNIDSLHFHPLLYTKVMDYYNEQFIKDDEKMAYGTNYHAIIKGRLFNFSLRLEAAQKEQINYNRSRIHLEDIDSYNKKITFQFFHRDYCFVYPFLFNKILVDQSTAEILFEKWKDVEVKRND